MKQLVKIFLKSIVSVYTLTMLFSCTNDTQKVRDFLAAKNLPTGKSKNAFHVYKDSGRITSKLITPLMLDFSNRKEHPYNEFPEGIKIINFENNGRDSLTVIGDYAISYSKTSISEIIGNVVALNHSENSKLETEQLYWDQKAKYFFSEKAFTLTTLKDTIKGVGFESKEDLSKWLSKNVTGNLETEEK
jgi:LPS export ABC transporter protein LptC